jgi:alpha-galactosidase
LIGSEGIDLYRQDFNIDPLGYWRGADPPDRQGITEIRYAMGFLSFWDELRRRHPQMLIDTCASGGRRNDLETLRRAVPLLRSDYILEPVSQQNHTYGIASWIPFYGTGVNAFDAYTFRSQQAPHSTACYDMRNDKQDFPAVKRLVEQWRQLGPMYFGDYYPLTPYNPGADAWMGWQFHRDDQGSGFVQVFRRHESIYEAARLRLRGLAHIGRYRVVNLDAPQSGKEYTGAALMQSGLPITVSEQPGAIILRYERVFH